MERQIIDIQDQLEKNPDRRPWKKRRQTNRIAIHHSETHGQSIFDLNYWHVEHNNWYRVSYHYAITPAGVIYKCNDEKDYTYHVGRSNKDTLGVCVIGNFDNEELEGEQKLALIELVVDLCMKYEIGSKDVVGHRELPGYQGKKTCPGTNIKLEQLRDRIANEHVKQLDLKIAHLETKLHKLEEIDGVGDAKKTLAESKRIRRAISKRTFVGGL